MKKILLTQFYIPKEESHQKELLQCLKINLAQDFDEIILFFESDHLLSDNGIRDPKIKFVMIGERLTFKKAFHYSNTYYPGHVCVLANSDIFFDDSIQLANRVKPQEVFCLSRYNYNYKKKEWYPFTTKGSFDVWIYQTPLQVRGCDFMMGMLRCDSVLAHQLKSQGLSVSNPSKSIKCCHLDSRKQNHKTWAGKKGVPGQAMGIDATAIE